MGRPSVRKTFKYKLAPTPAQDKNSRRPVALSRTVQRQATEERKTAWEQCGVSVTFATQSAQLPGLKAACAEFSENRAHVLQEVMVRLDRPLPAL